MSGRLIVLEGLDGSGKSTQLELLRKRMTGEVRYVKFPDYASESSALVRMYLDGKFGTKPEDVNAYAASAFYAVDRYASFKTDWGADYLRGATVVCDRYATSNAVHQASKLKDDERDSYLDWLYDFEFCRLGIPKPDAVIFLDMPVSVSQKLMTERYHGDEKKKDVHEANVSYLNHCRDAALYVAKKYNWIVIDCAKNGEPLSIEEINGKILDAVLSIM